MADEIIQKRKRAGYMRSYYYTSRGLPVPDTCQQRNCRYLDSRSNRWRKICARCGKDRDCESEYHRNQRRCIPCKRQIAIEYQNAHPDYARRHKEIEAARTQFPAYGTTRFCIRCEQEQPIGSFFIRHRGYRRRICSGCSNENAAKTAHAPHRIEKRQKYIKNYKRNNPDKMYANDQKRRARKRAAPYELVNRQSIIERDNSTCYLWCGRKLLPNEITLDHVIPLARGGTHTADNLRVACGPCNFRKWKRTPEELGFQNVSKTTVPVVSNDAVISSTAST